MTATYAGNSTFAGSAGQFTLVVNAVGTTLAPTTTTVTCNPNPDTVSTPTTCTAAVADGTVTPTGTVTFITAGGGSFASPASCTLIASGTCPITYTPSATDSQTLTATYGGDAAHSGSSGQTTLVVNAVVTTLAPTTTTINCTPNPVTVGSPSTCSPAVTGGTGSPTGTFSLSSNGPGGFVSPGATTTCTLGSGSNGTCNILYTPTAAGAQTLTAIYSGDATHAPSSAATILTATAAAGTASTTTTTLACTPNPVTTGSATCTASVTDGGSGTPGGTVSVTSNGPGTFAPGSCTLSAAGTCSVVFTPSATGAQTLTASYGGSATFAASSGTTVLTVAAVSVTPTTVPELPTPLAGLLASLGAAAVYRLLRRRLPCRRDTDREV